MGKLTYVLRKNKNGSGTIQLHFNYGTKNRLRYSTGLRISDSKNWDSKKMIVKRNSNEVDTNRINNELNKLKHYLIKEYYKLEDCDFDKVNNDVLKNLCDSFFGKEKKVEEEQGLCLMEFYDWFIINYQIKPLMSTGKLLKSGTAKTYRNALNVLKRFNLEVYKVNYETISISFYNDFINWLYDKKYSSNYVGTQIKILKTIMNASFELGYHQSIEHNRKYFKKPKAEVLSIFLNEDELLRINSLDILNMPKIRLSKTTLKLSNEKIDRARDLFLISAYTGLRVSDFNRLEERNILNIDGKNYFKIITQKNGKTIVIPINSIVQKILDKRNGKPPQRLPNQHINYALKEIGKLAKIDSRQKIIKDIGGVKKEMFFKKFELITNHTGRRSFCTNAYLSGMPSIDVMAISGHSTEKVFYSYIKVNHLQRAVHIAKHDFFK